MIKKTTITIFILASVLYCNSQKIDTYPQPQEPVYKTVNPDSSKLKINKTQLDGLSAWMNITQQEVWGRHPNKIWMALTNPLKYNAEYSDTWCWSAGDYNNPVLANWSQMNEELFTYYVLFTQFFCTYFSFKHPDSVNYSIDDKMSLLSAFKKLKQVNIDYPQCPDCKISIRKHLNELQKTLSKNGYTFLVIMPSRGKFLSRDNYLVFTTYLNKATQMKALFKKLGLTVKSLKEI